MSTTISPSLVGLHYFQSEVGVDAVMTGLASIGVIRVFLTSFFFLAVSAIVARVIGGHLFPNGRSQTLIFVLQLSLFLTLLPLLEAVGGGYYEFSGNKLGAMLFSLAAEIMLPIFTILLIGFGLLEFLRFSFGLRFEPETKRMLATLSFIFLFAVTAPSLQQLTGEIMTRFVSTNLVTPGGAK
jgi:hypothetical protein